MPNPAEIPAEATAETPARTPALVPVLIYGAAGVAGFGGLLLEMVFLRRHGLLLGNTAVASAVVLALFLLALGVGGLWWPRTRVARRRPLGVAAILYAAVAAVTVAGDALLRVLPPLDYASGVGVALLCPGLPALLMGGAFPLLFSIFGRHAPPWRGALLVGANLAGSVAATFAGGNFAIPSLGLTNCVWIGAAAYAATALLVAVGSRSQGVRVDPGGVAPPLVPLGVAELTAFTSGFFVLGLELWMLRRLPFFLDGFQPTLSGVLAACLFGLTIGSIAGPPLVRALFRGRRIPASAGSVILAAAVAALGLQEWLAPAIGRAGVDSDLGFHLRIFGAAFAAAGVPCFFLGATIPLCLEGFVHPETRAPLAGRLFFFQGLGSLVGALVVGQILPVLLPRHFFAYGVSALALVAVLGVTLSAVTVSGGKPAGGRRGWGAYAAVTWIVLLGVLDVTNGSAFRHDPAPVAGSRYDRPPRYRYIAHRTDDVVTASVVYDRQAHGLILFTDEFRAAYIGPDSGYMTVLGHLPFLLRESLERVAVIALGTGTTANAVHRWPDPRELHVVEISSAVLSMVDHFAKDGPGIGTVRAPYAEDPRTVEHVTDGRRFVARRPPASLDLISMEPLLPYAPGTVPLYTREFYRQCAAALSDDGLMVQWVPTHSMPELYFKTLLATFARSFPHHSIWLLNHSTLLVGSRKPHLPPLDELRGRMNRMPAAARRDLHAAGIATAVDLVAAFVGTDALRVCDVPDLRDDRPFLERLGYWSAERRFGFLPANLALLRDVADRPGTWPGVREWRGLRVDRLQGLHDMALARVQGDPTHDALALLALGRTRDELPGSVLLFGELRRAQRERMEKEARQALVPDLARPLADRARIERQLAGDPGSAVLWAILALHDKTEQDQRAHARRALALDPTVFERIGLRPSSMAPADFADSVGPFDSLTILPTGEELVRRATVDNEDGVAFRARYRVRVGYAFLDVLAARSLSEVERNSFRSLLDPALLSAAVRHIRERGGDVASEGLPLWRRDLVIPAGIEELAKGSSADRAALAGALGRRRGRTELSVLADLLLDTDLAVRRVAAVALFQTVGDRVGYDPEAPATTRGEAVDAFRKLVRSR